MTKRDLILSDMIQKISSGVYKPGEFLPSELELTQLYNVSRETIRKDLAILAQEGYIQKIKGHGSLVLDARLLVFPVSDVTSYQELVETQKINSETKLLELSSVDSIPSVFRKKTSQFTRATFVKRLRLIDGDPEILDKDWVLKDTVPYIPRSVAETSLFSFFEQQLGLKISYAIKRLTVERATDEDHELLKIPFSDRVVVVRSETHLANTNILSYTESRHSPDHFEFDDFARREYID